MEEGGDDFHLHVLALHIYETILTLVDQRIDLIGQLRLLLALIYRLNSFLTEQPGGVPFWDEVTRDDASCSSEIMRTQRDAS